MWLLTASVIGGVLVDSLFLLLTVALLSAAVVVLAKDPNDP